MAGLRGTDYAHGGGGARIIARRKKRSAQASEASTRTRSMIKDLRILATTAGIA